MQLKDLIRQTAAQFRKAGITSPVLDVQILAGFVLNKDKSWLIANSDYRLNSAQLKLINDLAKKRLSRVPIAYILKTKEFYGLDFFTNDSVLIPRNETETLVEWSIKLTPKNAKVLDIGTGSGAIAIAIKKNRADLAITATDISVKAINLARKNADNILGKDKIQFTTSDLFNKINSKFDLIIANLPYVPNNMKNKISPEAKTEPKVALFGGESNGLDIYSRFFAETPKYLSKGGYLLIECDNFQKTEIADLAKENKLKLIRKDYLHLAFKH
ncbi:MAG: peptide chain release factor N(5)-glutamine methyltransferase [bacterium]|nr:peptide chain release factor N(5)-glutamine methyltransferase [bacterium]